MYTYTVPVVCDGGFEKEELLRELKSVGAGRIALALSRGPSYPFSEPETAKRLEELVRYYRENGLEVAIWIGETLGHDQVTLFPEGCETPYRRMKLPRKGTVASFCPTDESFCRDICLWIAEAARMKPDLIMLDDDFRMNGGCCCAEHTRIINEKLGEELPWRELYLAAFTGGANKYRDAWMDVQGETLENFARRIRAAVDEVDPGIRIGVCAAHYLWDADGTDPVKIARILAGGNRPFIRTFGAPYHSADDRNVGLGSSVELERGELARIDDPEIEVITEGDTYPRPRHYCPASYLECFDQILRAEGKADGILKYAADYVSSVGYERGYFDAWKRSAGLDAEIDRLFGGKTAVGVTPYSAPHQLRKADLGTEARDGTFSFLKHSTGNYDATVELAVSNGLPTAYEGDGALILLGENARDADPALFDRGCVLDLRSAAILTDRGVDVGIASVSDLPDTWLNYLGGVNQYFVKDKEYVRAGGAYLPRDVRLRNGAEVLSEYVLGDRRIPGWYKYENAAGQRFLVMTLDALPLGGRSRDKAGYVNGYCLKRLLENEIPWLMRRAWDAYVPGDHPFLYTLVKKDESSLSVGIWNLFADEAQNVQIRASAKYKKVRFVACEGEKTDSGALIKGPVKAFGFAGVEFYN